MRLPETFPVLGLPISAVTLESALATLERAIESREKWLVCVCTAYTTTLAQHDPELRSMVESCHLITPDGYPLTRLGRRRAESPVGRVRGTDTMMALCQRSAEKGYKNYLYGGTLQALEALSIELRRRFPNIQIVGARSPPFRAPTDEEFRADVDEINKSRADIVWVGLGCPKQEKWARRSRPSLDAPLIMPVGAAFDFLSGAKSQAPRWIRAIGLEFLWRFLHEPRRLWSRVLVHGLRFVFGTAWETITGTWRRDAKRLDDMRREVSAKK